MKIYNKNNNLILDIEVDDSSFCQSSIMGDKTLTLNYSFHEWIEVPLGSWCEFKNEKYFLFRPENFKKNHSRNWEHTLLMETYQAILRNFKFRSLPDIPPKLKFSLTGTPEMFLELLIANLNNNDSGWSKGTILDAEEKTLDFNNISCMDALNQFAEAFNTEWEIKEKVISLAKIDKNKENNISPVSLSYGKGKGFKSGLGRSNSDKSVAITRLYVSGGSKNIDPLQYGTATLLLPKDTEIRIEEKTYQTDEHGIFMYRTDITADTIIEGSIDLSHIYPKWTGVVSVPIEVNDNESLYDFIDDSIPDSLDFNNYLIPDTKMLLSFQTGLLSGKEFEVNIYDHTQKRFELVPVEESGYTFPKKPIIPAPGDKYAVFQINLPQEYIDKAQNEMLNEAAKYFYDNEEPRFSFTGELDSLFAKTNWETIGGYLDIGYYINFSDNQFLTDAVPIRIISIKEYVNNPYAPVIELSNVASSNTFANKIAEIAQQEIAIDRKNQEVLRDTKRRWRDAKETQQNMFDVLLDYFSEGISPITVETMQILTGSPALQFIFLKSKNDVEEFDPGFYWNSETGYMEVKKNTWLKHMTLGIEYIGGEPSEYKFWSMPIWHSDELPDSDLYFLYAKCSKANENGNYLISKEQITIEGKKIVNKVPVDFDSNNYYFLIGMLNSDYEGERSWAPLYGYTEVLPGQITARRFQSTDGFQFWDFTKKQFRIGDQYSSMDYNVTNPNKVTIRGGLTQDGGGNQGIIPLNRGLWDVNTIYYLGNEITWNGGTYLYVNSVPTKGYPPSDQNYWTQTVAPGSSASLVQISASALIFKKQKDGTYNPATITLATAFQNISNPTYKWQSSYGDGAWADITGATRSIFTVTPFAAQAVTFRCVMNNDTKLSDEVTIAKVEDGSDAFTVVLDNEAHAVECSSDGTPITGELGTTGKAKTKVQAYKGAIPLNSNSVNGFLLSIKSYDGCTAVIQNYDTVYINTMTKDSSYVELSVVCQGTEIIKKFTLTKTKQGIAGAPGTPGADGKAGDYTVFVYTRNPNTPKTPEGTTNPPNIVAGWSNNIPTTGSGSVWMSQTKFSGETNMPISGATSWSSPVKLEGTDGKDGKDGKDGAAGSQGVPGAAMVFRGEYNKNAQGQDVVQTYYGNPTRRDVVKYGSAYYITLDTAGTFSGIVPTNISKWTGFETSLQSVATGLLFTEKALIAGWYFYNNRIISQNNNAVLDGNADTNPRIMLGGLDVNTAPTRMYGDGRIITNALQAVGGKIGGFQINSDFIGSNLGTDEYPSKGMTLNNSVLKFANSDGSRYTLFGIGSVAPSSGARALMRIVDNSSASSKFGIIVGVTGGYGENTAIKMDGGYLSGLAIKPKRLLDTNFDYWATNEDVILTCYSDTKDGTVFLPENPERGKVIYVRQMNSRRNYVRSTVKQIYTTSAQNTNTYIEVGHGACLMLMYDGQYWICNKMGL